MQLIFVIAAHLSPHPHLFTGESLFLLTFDTLCLGAILIQRATTAARLCSCNGSLMVCWEIEQSLQSSTGEACYLFGYPKRLVSKYCQLVHISESLASIGTPLFPSLEMELQKTVRNQLETPKVRPAALKSIVS
ncbi:unnamed protein product [Fraxinus pennsylvanica]|uniref:Uncharacterized protein n=1 Tax=Fraxinus pennsylvanica TaxID=56036 RepID=A0AAD2ABI8_9LAMI|nr:unnamed protein product [Fraxinus pennsylvanica]